MKHYKSIKQNFEDCPFNITLPKIIVVKQFINIGFAIHFKKKTPYSKYLVKKCTITDKVGYKANVPLEGQNNFLGNKNPEVHVNDEQLLNDFFTFVVNVLTMDGNSVDVTYSYAKNTTVKLKSVAVADMTEDEKDFFQKTLMSPIKPVPVPPDPTPLPPEPSTHKLIKYINAISCELYFLKNHGGKKYKVTDGCLLTPNSNEFCYSFELESELYLSDDAPVSVLIGLETVNGTVIVCDGFQIIVSLERNIGDKVSSAQISVEPWKLLENLKKHIEKITPQNRIAWKLFEEGPCLASKNPDVATILCGQEAAIEHALDQDITVVWGPPGTGKTYTMAQMTERFVSMGKRVLIVSHSNISVDNVVKQIYNQFSVNHLAHILPQGKVLRYGYVRDEELSSNEYCVAFNFALNRHTKLKEEYLAYSEESGKLKKELEFRQDSKKAEKRKELEKQLKKIRTQLKEESKNLTAKAQVVATTVSKIYMDKLFEYMKYDVVMFDEVSMAYVPQLLCAATFAKEKFICVGDFRQLSPIVQSKNAKDVLETDIFSFLNISKNSEIYNHPWLVMLNEQRRMHPHISRFSSQRIYKGLLKDHTSVATKWNLVVSREPLPDTAMALIDLYGTFCAASKNADNSRFNILSAILSFAIALKAETAQQGEQFKETEKTGIITPYAAHTRLIRALIQDYRQKDQTSISCATVHQFQGSERNVVIFDAVESYPFIKPGWLVSKNENNSVMRLINVALTRARCKFITLANTRFWNNKFKESQNTYFKLLEHIKVNNTVVDIKEDKLFEFIKDLEFGANIKPYFSADDALENLLKDLKYAKKKIVITLPTDKLNPKYGVIIAETIQSVSKSGVTVVGKAKELINLNEAWKEHFYKSKDAAFPLIVIDDKVTWYGFPLSELYFEDKNYKFAASQSLIFRITGKHTNEMIHSLCDLDYYFNENGAKVKLMEKAGEGLVDYIYETESCKKCGAPMKLSIGHSGKYIMKCSACGKTDMISIYTLNKYLDKVNAKCPFCGKDLYAHLGHYGLQAKCSNDHFIKLSKL